MTKPLNNLQLVSSNKTLNYYKCYNSGVAEPPPSGGHEDEEQGFEGDKEDEEESESDEESEEEDDDEMEHSGTESDKAVSMPPDIIATTAPTITGEPDVSSSPPATTSADHMTTEDTPTDEVDTPSAATNQQNEEPGKVTFFLK